MRTGTLSVHTPPRNRYTRSSIVVNKLVCIGCPRDYGSGRSVLEVGAHPAVSFNMEKRWNASLCQLYH